jgi:uncharacterized protein (TIGR01777 family)
MKIGITGATGFIGTHIVGMALEQGCEVIGFTRNPLKKIPGCIETRNFSPGEKVNVDGCGAIIHLAGENVFGLWTSQKKRRIRDSRTLGTRQLTDAILASASPPRVFVSGSAIGFYGDTGEREVDEDSPSGDGFLADVCKAWEAEAVRARGKNVRVILLRTSLVLGKNGGPLRIMAPLFRAGLGGVLGSGRQWMSWIHIDDIAALALSALRDERIEGPLNAVAPQPVRNADFTRALDRAVHRPAFFKVPAFVLKTALGDFSHELLDSKRIVSKRATAVGFTHRFPSLDSALAEICAQR